MGISRPRPPYHGPGGLGLAMVGPNGVESRDESLPRYIHPEPMVHSTVQDLVSRSRRGFTGYATGMLLLKFSQKGW